MSKILGLFFLIFFCISSASDVTGDIQIISRASWGANEDYRLLDSVEWKEIIKQKILAQQKQEESLTLEERIEIGRQQAISYDASVLRNEYLLQNFAEDIDIVQTTTQLGEEQLAWNQKYTRYVNSIVIHHTEGNYKDGYDAVRKIYKYHAINRQWGDIGYNYLVGPGGEIFEGRAGGDYVVGAHNKWNNRSTVGIALIGSYQNNEPSEIQLLALKNLSLFLSKKYGIDMSKKIPIHNTCKGSDCPAAGLVTEYFHPLTGHRDGGHTACPGDKLYAQIENIRLSILEQTKGLTPVENDFIQQGKLTVQERIQRANIQNEIQKKIAKANDYNQALRRFNLLPWSKVKLAIDKIAEVKLLKVYAQVQVANQKDDIDTYKKLVLNELESLIGKRLLSDNADFFDRFDGDFSSVPFDKTQTIKIKLSYPHNDFITIKSQEGFVGELAKLGENYEIPFVQDNNTSTSYTQLEFTFEGTRGKINDKVNITTRSQRKFRIKSPDDGYLEISSWERKPDWDNTATLNDNIFKGDIIVYREDGKLVVVNELPIHDYLKGLGEVSDFEDPQKIKTIVTAARTYARWYTTKARKFEEKWYDGIDDPDVFQKYLGYGLEKRSPNINEIVDETIDIVITHRGDIIKPWYHSSSNGKTVSFRELCKTANGIPDCETPYAFPFLASVRDFSKDATIRKGHGVGIPGTGVSDLAEKGWNYSMIIKYFLPGTEVEKVSNPKIQ